MDLITPIYAGLIGLLLLWLSARVIGARRSERVLVGDGDNKLVKKRMRVQANCVEYAPLCLILILMAELQGAPALAVHILGGALVLGRVMHALGLGGEPQIIPLRFCGMILTFLVLICAALANIGHAIW